jgi:glycosyltransferase involved in cell wall biosynthesis
LTKILHILDEIRHSGAEVMLKSSAHLFIENNIELSALSTGKNEGIYADKLRNSGFAIYHIPFRKTPLFFFQVIMLLRKQKFDIVQIHVEGAFFWYSLAAKIGSIKKIIRIVHSTYRFTGFLRLRRKIQRLISRKILKVKFVSVSSAVRELEEQNFENPTLIIKNWIDENYFRPPLDIEEKESMRKKVGIPNDKIIIVSVGNCSEVKNHSDILRAMNELIKWRKDIFYIHAGKGELEDKEIKLAEDLGIKEFTIFAGAVDNVRDLLIASDIFVMTSQYEGLGNSCLEAGSCGLPLVIYDSPGLKETVEQGYNGIIIEPNYKLLCTAIKKVAEDEKTRIRMGRNARKFVISNFSTRNSINKLFNLYFN